MAGRRECTECLRPAMRCLPARVGALSEGLCNDPTDEPESGSGGAPTKPMYGLFERQRP